MPYDSYSKYYVIIESLYLILYVSSFSVLLHLVISRSIFNVLGGSGFKFCLFGIIILFFAFAYRSVALFVMSKGDFEVSYAPYSDVSEEVFTLLYEVFFSCLCGFSMIIFMVGAFLIYIRANHTFPGK